MATTEANSEVFDLPQNDNFTEAWFRLQTSERVIPEVSYTIRFEWIGPLTCFRTRLFASEFAFDVFDPVLPDKLRQTVVNSDGYTEYQTD